MFEPGQLVECIDDGSDRVPITPPIRRGAIYTVKGVAGSVCWLHEVDPPSGYSAFFCSAFRPLPEERLTVFREMLNVTPVEAQKIDTDFVNKVADELVRLSR